MLIDNLDCKIEELKELIQINRFEPISSTKLELENLIKILAELEGVNQKVTIFTDSQNIVGLPGRRKKLEANDYISANNKRLKNHKLYREFYRLTDSINCEFVKVKGHSAKYKKDAVDKIFTLVDKAARKAIRNKD